MSYFYQFLSGMLSSNSPPFPFFYQQLNVGEMKHLLPKHFCSSTYQDSCSGEELFLGTTPLKPIELPEGSYMLLVPENYVWEHKGPIEVSVAARQKTFFLLKLFKRYSAGGNGGPGGSGGAPGGGGGGSGSGGVVGAPPP